MKIISLKTKLRFLRGNENLSRIFIAPNVWIPSWLVADFDDNDQMNKSTEFI